MNNQPTRKTLFGEIISRHVRGTENVATEGLLYLLKEYASARQSLRLLLAQAVPDMQPELHYRTQAGAEDGSIPDLIGEDKDGKRVLIMEAKFWAGLTPNQPGSYIQQLPEDQPAMVLVVAPGQRVERLWRKLISVCQSIGLSPEKTKELGTEFMAAAIGGQKQLGIISWRQIISAIKLRGESEGNTQLVADADQLSGLCEKMDSDAFLPLSDDEMSPALGRRIAQYPGLIDSVVRKIEHQGGSTQGLRPGGVASVYGRNFRFQNLGMFLCFHPKLWSTKPAETPIWLSVTEPDFIDKPEIPQCLGAALASTDHFICLRKTRGGSDRAWIAIDLPLGVEQDEVIEDIVRQIKFIAKHAKPNSPQPTDPTAHE